MRVKVLIKMYNGKLEIYGNDNNFEFTIKHNDKTQLIVYNENDDIFKPILVLEDNDTLCFLESECPFTFIRDGERWKIINTVKNKILKNKKMYLLAISSDSAKRGLFHNVQKEIISIQKKVNQDLFIVNIIDSLERISAEDYEISAVYPWKFSYTSNTEEVKQLIIKYCNEFNNHKITIEELYDKVINIDVKWSIKDYNILEYCPLNRDTKKLKEIFTWWTLDYFKKYIE